LRRIPALTRGMPLIARPTGAGPSTDSTSCPPSALEGGRRGRDQIVRRDFPSGRRQHCSNSDLGVEPRGSVRSSASSSEIGVRFDPCAGVAFSGCQRCPHCCRTFSSGRRARSAWTEAAMIRMGNGSLCGATSVRGCRVEGEYAGSGGLVVQHDSQPTRPPSPGLAVFRR